MDRWMFGPEVQRESIEVQREHICLTKLVNCLHVLISVLWLFTFSMRLLHNVYCTYLPARKLVICWYKWDFSIKLFTVSIYVPVARPVKIYNHNNQDLSSLTILTSLPWTTFRTVSQEMTKTTRWRELKAKITRGYNCLLCVICYDWSEWTSSQNYLK